MKFYLAPMEGLTGHIFRKAQKECFGGIDKYFTPFVAANTKGKLSSRHKEDLMPDHNEEMTVVPQILTNKSEDFIQTALSLKAYGYNEINLNLGCPSGTVVAKNRGAGFLSKVEELDCFLDEIYTKLPMKISIKTRLGKDEPSEFYELMKIYNQYPIEELIIHPRIQKDYYKNKPRLELFEMALSEAKCPICYNGDIFTKAQYEEISGRFKTLDTIMLGRGVISNPGLVKHIKQDKVLQKSDLRKFHDQVCSEYQKVLYGEKNVLFKMKEIWFYMIHMFSEGEKYGKKIRKAQSLKEYNKCIDALFSEQNILEKGGLFQGDQS